MQYVIKDNAGNEHGPADEATLVKWASEQRINARTQIRSVLVNNWKECADLDFLKPHVVEPEDENKKPGMFGSVSDLFSSGKAISNSAQGFLQRRLAQKAKLSTRFMAFLFDAILFSIIAFVIFGYLISSAVNKNAAAMSDGDIAPQDRLIDEKEYNKRMFNIKRAKEYADYMKKKTEADAKAAESGAQKQEEAPAPPPPPPPSNEGFGSKADLNAQFGGAHDGSAIKEKVSKEKIPEKAEMPVFEVVNNDKAIGVPTRKADFKAGYMRGSVWTQVSTGNKFVCLRNDEDDALWCNVADFRNAITIGSLIMVLIILLYYTLCIGYFAQTFGMWFWGLFVARPGKDTREAYFFRAFLFALFMIPFGLLMPIFVFICGCGIHDLLAGVRVYHIAGKAA